MQSYVPCKLHVVAVAADSWEPVVHGRAALHAFFPQKTPFSVSWIATEIQGTNSVLASSGKAFGQELQSFEMDP